MSGPLTLADYAALERDAREQYYPEMVIAGKLDGSEARHDWLCWKSIADWIADPAQAPSLSVWQLGWADLAAAGERALAKREEALASCKPANREALEQRRDAVAVIALRLQRRADFYRTLNDQLRRDADQRRATTKEAA